MSSRNQTILTAALNTVFLVYRGVHSVTNIFPPTGKGRAGSRKHGEARREREKRKEVEEERRGRS